MQFLKDVKWKDLLVSAILVLLTYSVLDYLLLAVFENCYDATYGDIYFDTFENMYAQPGITCPSILNVPSLVEFTNKLRIYRSYVYLSLVLMSFFAGLLYYLTKNTLTPSRAVFIFLLLVVISMCLLFIINVFLNLFSHRPKW